MPVSRMLQERFPKQALLAKVKGKRQSRNAGRGRITLISGGIAWGFTQGKRWKW